MEALGQLVLAGAFAGWYWTFKKPDNLPPNALSSSFYRAIRYHLGKLIDTKQQMIIMVIIIELTANILHFTITF